jgi:L-threonylcarbamoyladenylate synthase
MAMAEQENIKEAIKVLQQGGIVIFPTDTAFGMGCRIDRHESIERLFAIRQRPLTMTPPVLVSSLQMAEEYAVVSDTIKHRLIEKYWPGAVTVIMPAKERVDGLVQKDGGIGLRLPNHPTPQALISGVGVPVIGTSANFHGNPTPYKTDDLDPELTKLVDFVVEGSCTVCRESTVISCMQDPWKIFRQGAVTIESYEL